MFLGFTNDQWFKIISGAIGALILFLQYRSQTALAATKNEVTATKVEVTLTKEHFNSKMDTLFAAQAKLAAIEAVAQERKEVAEKAAVVVIAEAKDSASRAEAVSQERASVAAESVAKPAESAPPIPLNRADYTQVEGALRVTADPATKPPCP
jgi:hypothetical protein